MKKVIFSKQAQVVIESLKDFRKDQFLEWLEGQAIEIGSNTILEFLMRKDKEEKENAE